MPQGRATGRRSARAVGHPFGVRYNPVPLAGRSHPLPANEVTQMDKPNVLVCSAWPYASGVPHLGNLVSSLLSGDVFARYYRMRGHAVLYVSGTDAHGTRIMFEARQLGIPPAELAERNHRRIVEILDGFDVRFDNYTTTESATHHRFVHDIFLQMEAGGYIFAKAEDRAFCRRCALFLADRFITGTCPKCGAEGAMGNQCDACGSILEPEELVAPTCSLCGKREIEFRATRHWFLDLPKLTEPLEEYVRSRPFQGNVLRFTSQMITGGLRPRAMTRDISWGIPAPFDGAEDKVIYVWGEAALGYVSAVIEHFNGAEDWRRFWFGDEVHQIYTLGKDNIPFHTVIFPGQLIASGQGYHLPDQIAATEYLNWISGQSFSKSRGVGLYCDDALELLNGDLWRFYLLLNRPEGRDVDFSWGELEKAINGVLISNVANLINRVISFVQDRYDGTIPDVELDPEAVERVGAALSDVERAIDDGALGKALRSVCDLAVSGNEYFQRKAPWASGDATAVASAFYVVRALALLLSPFVPGFAGSVLAVMGISEPSWDEIEAPVAGAGLTSDRVLLERIDVEALQARVEKKEASAPETERVSMDTFASLDLRVGTIVSAEAVEGTDRLLKLAVDIGKETRTCVAGIRSGYAIDGLVGRQVAVVVNLEPAKIRGILSECMLLAASDNDGLALLSADRDVPPGTRIG